MKKTIMCVAALIVAAIVSVTVVSCKKDKDEVVTKATNSEAQALLNRIEAFQTLRDAVNSGAKADGSMTVEEMRQALDLVSNYEHSEHMTYCENTVLDTLHVAMPAVDGEGYVSNADVVATYNAFETALEKCMLGVNDGMDVPSLFCIVMPETGSEDENEINIVFTRGEETIGLPDDVRYPFIEGDDWVYGKNLGLCYPGAFNVCSDVAKQLSEEFRYDYTSPGPGWVLAIANVEYVTYTAYDCDLINQPNGWVYWEPETTLPCVDHWLFLMGGEFDPEPCISWEEMNCYWSGFNDYIIDETGPLHYSPTYHSPCYECVINWHHHFQPGLAEGDRRSVRQHTITVKYGHPHWINTIPDE